MKIYSINKTYKPFTDTNSIEYLHSKGISYTNNIISAEVILSPSTKSKKFKFLKFFFYWKKFLIYTNEPREDLNFETFIKKKLTIMNVYSGNVFFNNLHFLGSYHFDQTNNLGIKLNTLINSNNNFYKKNCIAVFQYKDPVESKLLNGKKDLSLNAYRQNLAIYLNSKGKCDIAGSNWPDNVNVIEESGFESGGQTWWDRKIRLLQNYKFNICIENTAFPFYCTEKIWHSIISGCLPIYFGKNTAIYDDFSQNSFIDASNFETFDELYEYLENISYLEYSERYNRCKQIMIKSFETKNKFSAVEIIEKFTKALKEL